MADRYEPGEREWAVGEAARLNQESLARLNAQFDALNDDNTNAGTTNNVATPNAPTNSGTSISTQSSGLAFLTGQKGGTKSIDQSFPGARKDNPLSRLSSYTYAISLYMVTPEAMNFFVNNGGRLNRSFIQTGIFTVAQSGGINNSSEMRAITNSGSIGRGQEGLDFYIDDFSVNTFLPGNPQNLSSLNTEFKFKIIEPIGFSFLTALSRASAEVNKYSNLVKNNNAVLPNSLQQNYIIGIKFYGYNENGSLVKATDVDFKNYDNGLTDGNSVIERYFPIKMSSVTFRLDNNITTYNCTAQQAGEAVAYSTNVGVIDKTINIVASTVGEALRGNLGESPTNDSSGLIQNLNQYNKDLQDRNAVKLPTQYDIQFEPGSPIESSAVTPENKDASSKSYPMSSAKTTQQVTVAQSLKATTINTTKKVISIAPGTPILKAIDNIITNSSYITDAIKQKNSQRPETTTSDKPGTGELKWYSVNPVVNVIGRDPLTQNWAHKIVFQIKTYNIPYIRTTYQAKPSKYPGPYKFYNYWYSGENSEILSYEQEYNNLYYVPNQVSTSQETVQPSNVNKTTTPIAPKTVAAGSPVGGELNQGSQINQSVRAQLYSPGDQVEAKIKILGDPDYLMSSVGVNTPMTSAGGADASKIYGNDLSINPFGGQVLIQIAFNTASDYQNNGLLDVSDAIQFYETDAVAKAGIKGIVYKVVQVNSVFSKGMFTQTLDLRLIPSTLLLTGESDQSLGSGFNSSNQRETGSGNSGSTNGTGTGNNGDTRNALVQTSDDGSSIQTFDDGSTIITDTDGKISAIESNNNYPAPADDDSRPVYTPQTVQQAAEVYGRESAETFSTTQGGAALFPVRNPRARRVR